VSRVANMLGHREKFEEAGMETARPQGSPSYGARPGRDASRSTSRPSGRPSTRPAGRPVREDAWKRFAKPGRPSAGQTRSRRERDSR